MPHLRIYTDYKDGAVGPIGGHLPKKLKKKPGAESAMAPAPIFDDVTIIGSGKLQNRIAIVTGGDSGIGRAVAIAFAKEGADVAIVYLNEHKDADFTKNEVVAKGRRCIVISGDVGRQSFCKKAIHQTIKAFGRLDILVNNAAEQHPTEQFEKITEKQLDQTFRTNVYGYFFLTSAALPYLKKGAAIINTSSVTAYRGSSHLIDYSATKGAIVAFTRSLSKNLVEKGIRVNAVAPGPIWTPLVASTFSKKELAIFGKKTPMQRAGQPVEVAPCFVFLASADSSYMTGQVLHPNGGEIING